MDVTSLLDSEQRLARVWWNTRGNCVYIDILSILPSHVTSVHNVSKLLLGYVGESMLQQSPVLCLQVLPSLKTQEGDSRCVIAMSDCAVVCVCVCVCVCAVVVCVCVCVCVCVRVCVCVL